jgi:hypothetical protein
LALFCSFYASNAYADTLTNPPSDFVAFFKKAISLPPDIEQFIVGQRSRVGPADLPPGMSAAEKKTMQDASLQWGYFQGAREGSNYFLRKIEGSNLPNTRADDGLIAGRAGSIVYSFSMNSVSYSIGTNVSMSVDQGLFTLTRQFLDMGLADIEPESVVWSDNTFSAVNKDGFRRYGRLELSNNLPFRLWISMETNSTPFKVIEYKYPESPATLGGYPSKINISESAEDEPSVEIVLQSIKMAAQHLPESFFSEAQFKTTNITHVLIYSNDLALTSDENGKMIKLPKTLVMGLTYPQSRSDSEKRLIVYILFGIISIVPLAMLVRHRKTKNS